MKRKLSVGLGVLALAATIPFATSTPVFANLQQMGESIVESIMQPKVKMMLSAEKQIKSVDAEGKEVIAWEALEGKATVQPGDVLRYTLSSENAGDKDAQNLALTQPIPANTAYIAESARANGAALTYSIDGGSTFSAQPMVEVKQADGSMTLEPAPAEMYSHVRWQYKQGLQPLASVNATYEVTVK